MKVTEFIVKHVPQQIDQSLFEYKYAAHSLKDILGRTECIQTIEQYIQNCQQQLMILSGPCSSGKKSICKLLLSQLNYYIFEFDFETKNHSFMDRIERILQIHTTHSAILIYHFDQFLNETTFNRFYQVFKTKSCSIPVFCMTNTEILNKNYLKSTIRFLKVPYPNEQELILFVKTICEKQKLNLTIYSIRHLIQSAENIQKILHILQMIAYQTRTRKQKLTLKDMKQVICFSKTDTYLTYLDLLKLLFNPKRNESYDHDMIFEQPFSLTLYYSNLSLIKCMETREHLLEYISMADLFDTFMFSRHQWCFKYYMMHCCIGPMFAFFKPMKSYTLRKNMLNNLQGIRKKKRQCIQTPQTRFKLPYYEHKYYSDLLLKHGHSEL
jgi:hypothetical protein